MKLGYILATASWISIFALIWLMIAEVRPGREMIGYLVFFFLLAVVVSAIVASDKDGKKKKESNGRGRTN